MGILTKEVKSALVEKIDDLIKLKGISELADGFVIKIVIDLLDDKVFAKIPVEYQDEFNDSINAIVTDQISEIPEILDDVLSGAINTPLINGTEVEQALYRGLLEIIVELLRIYVYKDTE